MYFKERVFIIILFFATVISGCKKINDSIINNPALSQNLADAISSDPNLSTFSGYIKKTGVDVLLQSSKTYTVWAPVNAALQSLDPAIVSDTARLKSFVLNHISNLSVFTRDVQTYIRVPMLNGKYNNFFGNKLEDANVTTADKYTSNGVLHIIDKALLVLPNLWEYINSTASQYTQNNFIAGLNFPSFNASQATIDSISILTGLPVYHPGTGIVIKNTFNERTFDTRREDKQYTYFIIDNAGFTLKADSLKPYFKSSSAAITDSLDKWNIVKDLIVDTLYPSVATLPNVIVSKFGISMPVNRSLIIDTKKLSNGIVYVLSSSATNTSAKFISVRREGENPSGFLSDKTSNTSFLRIRRNPVTGDNYSDLLVSGHGVTGYYAFYRLSEMPSMKYNVFALAVNDFQTAAVFQSLIPGFVSASSAFTALPVVSVQLPANTAQLSYAVPLSTIAGAYNEVFLGTFTSTSYGTLEIRLTSGGNALGSSGTGPIVLDYFRLVPVP